MVLECVEKATGTPHAVKVIRKKFPPGSNGTSDQIIEREVEALRMAKGHAQLIQLFDAFTTISEAALVLELCVGCLRVRPIFIVCMFQSSRRRVVRLSRCKGNV